MGFDLKWLLFMLGWIAFGVLVGHGFGRADSAMKRDHNPPQGLLPALRLALRRAARWVADRWHALTVRAVR